MDRKKMVEQGIQEFSVNSKFRELFIWICEEFSKAELKLATNEELEEECKKRGILPNTVLPYGFYIFDLPKKHYVLIQDFIIMKGLINVNINF